MLQFPIERETSFVAVVRQQRRQVVDLAEAGLAGLDGESFSATRGTRDNMRSDIHQCELHCVERKLNFPREGVKTTSEI